MMQGVPLLLVDLEDIVLKNLESPSDIRVRIALIQQMKLVQLP